MAVTPTTKSQVQAYRFVLRRMEHALVRKDAVMLHDPMRTQVRATAVGVVLGILALAGFALFALFKPSGGLGDSAIVMAKDSGSLYVRVDGVLHPVMNLASARLIVGQAAAPSSVSDSALADVPRGPLLGIPGGPSLLPGASERTVDVWTVCDSLTPENSGSTPQNQAARAPATTTVIAGALSPGAASMSGGGALLVKLPADVGGQTYLVYDGKRAKIDLSDLGVARALGLEDAAVRTMSPAVLNAIPEVAPVVAPLVPARGAHPTFKGAEKLSTAVVGSVLKGKGMSDDQYYLVLRDGVQQVAPAVARILQFAVDGTDPLPVSASIIGQLPPSQVKLTVENLPQQVPAVIDASDSPVSCMSCMSWDGTGGGSRNGAAQGQQSQRVLKSTVLAGAALPLPSGAKVVTLAQADGEGPLLDSVYVPPAKGAFIRAVAAPGADAGPLFLVGDTGVRFGVADMDTAGVLGLDGQLDPAPNQIISLLPIGPELSQHSALLAHDGVSSDPRASTVPKPGGP